MTPVKEFILSNFKTLFLILSFVLTMYVQHMNNTAQIGELKSKCAGLELKIQDDIREMRSDIKELLQK